MAQSNEAQNSADRRKMQVPFITTRNYNKILDTRQSSVKLFTPQTTSNY